MRKSSLAPEWDDYLAVLREDAHQLLAWGYADSHHRLPDAMDEYEITGLLTEAIVARINSPKTPDRFLYYAVYNEKPTSPSGELGKKRPKLDIQIEFCGPVRPRPQFTFEAKRLRDDPAASTRATLRHYLGEDGIQRFIEGRYSPDSIEAAMLGCVQCHDPEFWFDELGASLKSDITDGTNAYALVKHLQRITIVTDFPDERVSVHRKLTGALFKIYHLFIDCRPVSKN